MPTRGMDLQEWCEYLRDVKEAFHLTNAYIAKEAEVSITTVERIMAINIDQDIMRFTARKIETVVLGSVGQHFCPSDSGNMSKTIQSLKEEVLYWRKENDRKAKIIDKYID